MVVSALIRIRPILEPFTETTATVHVSAHALFPVVTVETMFFFLMKINYIIEVQMLN